MKMRITQFFYLFLFFLVPQNSEVKGQIFSAQTELEGLFTTSRKVTSLYKRYLEKEEERLEVLKRRYRKLQEIRDDPLLFRNPIGAFHLIKALTIELEGFLNATKLPKHARDFRSEIRNLEAKKKLPTIGEDLLGSVDAISRIMKTYRLSTEDFIKGQVRGHCCARPLSVDDCYQLALRNKELDDDMNPKYAYKWAKEALRLYNENKEDERPEVTKVEILHLLVNTSMKVELLIEAIKAIHEVTQLEPWNEKAKEDLQGFALIYSIAGEDVKEEIPDEKVYAEEDAKMKAYMAGNGKGVSRDKIYEALCRGEFQQKVFHDLKCQYIHRNHPYLLIGPVKMEVLYLDPDVFLFHDVIHESEIEDVKLYATPKLRRALIREFETGHLIPAKYRISQSAWLYDDNPIAETLSARVELITGLSMESAEPLQVVNYGLGGQYDYHYDFIQKGGKPVSYTFPDHGNRIATFLFYMSEVEEGGSTVFPMLDIGVTPKKGSALFWYNLFEDGNGDTYTKHGACPVILGSKWVVNKWIHEFGQEFIRPCKLTSSANNKRADM